MDEMTSDMSGAAAVVASVVLAAKLKYPLESSPTCDGETCRRATPTVPATC